MSDTPRIELGRLGRAVGLRGEVRLNRYPDFWPESLESERLRRESAEGASPARVTGSRSAGKSLVLSFDDVTDRDAAEALNGALLVLEGELDVQAPAEPRPFQVMGLEVRNMDGSRLGVVEDLELGAAQSLLKVRGADKEYAIPWVDAIVRKVEWEAGWIQVDPPPGLLEL